MLYSNQKEAFEQIKQWCLDMGLDNRHLTIQDVRKTIENIVSLCDIQLSE